MTELFQTAVGSGPTYTVPGPGVITKMTTFGDPDDLGDPTVLRVYRSQSPTAATAVFESESKPLVAGPNDYAVRFPVAGGELLGIVPGASGTCAYPTLDIADSHRYQSGAVSPLGTPFSTTSFNTFRMDVAAVLEPDADGDNFGDETQDLCPTDATKQGECVAPSAVLGKHPKKKASSPTATFKFSSDDPKATFTCAVDKRPLTPCTSPKKFRKLKPRKHKFKLVASDAAGNSSAQTTFRWRVVD